VILHGLAENRTLRAENAPRCKILIFLPSSALRLGRTLRLLSCHRSVDGLLIAVPAQPFAKLRSDKNQTKRHGSRFRACSLQSICRVFGDRTCVTCRQVDRSQDAGATAAVLGLCRWGTGRRQAGTHDDCGPQSDLMIAHTIDVQRPAECHEGRCVPFPRPAPCLSSAVS
jgi:hypothetical protein